LVNLGVAVWEVFRDIGRGEHLAVAEDSGSDTDISAKLRKLDRLRKDGLITDEEYEVLKAKAIRDYQ